MVGVPLTNGAIRLHDTCDSNVLRLSASSPWRTGVDI